MSLNIINAILKIDFYIPETGPVIFKNISSWKYNPMILIKLV